MRAELRRIEADASDPLQHVPSVLTRGKFAIQIAPASEWELSRLTASQPEVLVNRLTRLIREFEPHRPAGLLLADGRAIHGVTARRDIVDADSDDVAAAQLSVDR